MSHDITIEDVASGSAVFGFMLYRGQKGHRPFVIQDARTLRPRVLSMGERTEAEFPEEITAYWSQSDWRAGLGGINAKDHPLTIALGTKVDTSEEGRIINARELKTTTVDSNPSAFRPSGFAVVGTEVTCSIGESFYTWNYTNKDWDKGATTISTGRILRNGIEFSGKTYVPRWDVPGGDTPERYHYKADGDTAGTWTIVTAGTGTQVDGVKYFASGRSASGGHILWGGYVVRNDATFGKNIIVSTTDPTAAANWSSEVAIGESDSEITALVAQDEDLFICKTNGIWNYARDGTTKNLTPNFGSHPDNFRGAYDWNGHVLLPLGAGGLMDLFQGELRDISLKVRAPDQTALHGRVTAITGNATSVFILVVETGSTKYHLLMGKLVTLHGETEIRWHHMGEIPYTTSTVEEHSTLFYEGIPSGTKIHNRVWVGIESGGSNLLPHFLPQDTDDEDGYTNDTDGLIQFSLFDKILRKLSATWGSIDVESKNLGAGGRQYKVEYSLDGGAYKADLSDSEGNADSIVDTSPDQTMTFPAGTTAKTMEIRATPALTSVGTTSPEWLYFRVTYTLRPAALKILPLSLYLADGQVNYNSAPGGGAGRPKLDLAQLETWDNQPSEVVVKDARGTTRNMIFLPGVMKVEELANEYTRRPEYLATCFLVEV